MYSSFAFAPILYRIPRHAAGYGRGRGGLPLSLPLPVLFNPPVTTCHLLYILLGKTPRNATGHGRGGGEYPPPQSSEGIKRFKVILSILSLCSSQMR